MTCHWHVTGGEQAPTSLYTTLEISAKLMAYAISHYATQTTYAKTDDLRSFIMQWTPSVSPSGCHLPQRGRQAEPKLTVYAALSCCGTSSGSQARREVPLAPRAPKGKALSPPPSGEERGSPVNCRGGAVGEMPSPSGEERGSPVNCRGGAVGEVCCISHYANLKVYIKYMKEALSLPHRGGATVQ